MLSRKTGRILTLLLLPLLLLPACSNRVNEPAPKTITVVQTAPPNMLNQLKSGEIDGFIAWEPFVSDAVDTLNAKALVSSKDMWAGHPCCVLAVGANLDPEIQKALVWADMKAIQFINDPANKEKVLKYAQEFGGKSEKVTADSLKNIRYVEYPNEKEFREFFNQLKNQKLINKDVKDYGYAGDDEFFKAFLNKEMYDSIKAAEPAPVKTKDKVRLGYIRQDLHQLPMYIAKMEGYYKKVGLEPDVNLEMKGYANGVAIMEGFKNKELDASFVGGGPATLKRINDNIPIRIVAGVNEEGSALVTSEKVKSVEDLAGKTIAIPGVGTVQGFLLDRIAAKAGLKVVYK